MKKSDRPAASNQVKHSAKPAAHQRWAAPAVVIAALTTANAFAGTYTFTPQFETFRQSIFGSGNAAVSISKENQFLGARWGQADQGGPAVGQISSGNYVNGNGFLLRGETSGRIGLQYGLKIDSGSIDAALPWDVSITTPNSTTLVNGQKFLVGTSAQFKADQASFVTRSPTFQFYSDFIFETKARLKGQASVDLFFFDKQVSFDKTLVDVNVSQELIGVNRNNDGQLRVLPFLFSAASTARDAYDSAQAARELKQEVSSATGRREKVKVALRKMGVSFSLESPVEAAVRLPYIEMSGQNIVRDGNKIRQSDKDGFAEFSFDLDRIAGIMFPQIPPMTINADLDFAVGSLETSATLIDVDFNPTVNLTQQAEVEARKLKIDFDLGTNRAYRVLNADGSVASTVASSRFVTLDAGQNLELTYDGSEMNLLPTYRVEAGLNSQFGLSLSSELQFRALMASVEAKLFGLELGGFEIGPALQSSIQFPDVSLGNLFNRTFDLNGFSSIQGSALFISNRPSVFTGASGGTWASASNWTSGSSVGQGPDIGRSAIVPDGKVITATGTTNACFHLEVGQNAEVNVNGTLAVGGSIYNSGRFNVGAGGVVNLEEDATAQGAHTLLGGTFSLGNNSQVILKNNASTAAINADLTAVGTSLSMENASIKLQGGPGRLWLGNGTTVNVTNALANSANRSVIGTVDGYGLDIVKYGNKSVAVNLSQGGNLLVEFGSMTTVFPTQNPTPTELVEGKAAVIADMLTYNVGSGSTLSLKGSPVASNLSGLPNAGTIQGARFVTSGTGVVKNVGSLQLAASIFDGNFVADAGDSASGVTTTFQGQGSTTGSITPVVNNGTMTFIARPGLNNTIYTDAGAIAGKGEMRLIGYGNNPVMILLGGAPQFINGEGHTIRVDNAEIGRATFPRTSFNVYNKGNIIVDKALGSGTGRLFLDNGDGNGGDNFFNEGTGLIRLQNGATFDSNSARIGNIGRFEVGDLSTGRVFCNDSTMTDYSAATNLSTLFIKQGTWKTEYSGKLVMRNFVRQATIVSNSADLEESANFASPNSGIYIGLFYGSAEVPIESFATFRNESAGSFRLSLNSTLTFPDFENYGFLDVSNSTINGVQNFSSGTIFGSGEVKLQQTSTGVAANAGRIIAVRSENNGQLTVSAAAGVTTIQNTGTMGGMGADLVFPNNVIVSSSGGTMVGGTWVVEGGTTDYPNSARIIVPLANSNLTGLTNTKVTLKGSQATIDSSINGATIRSFQNTLTAINSGAILTLDANTQTFTNRVAINTGGQLILNAGGRVAGTGLDVYGLLAGNGSVNVPIKTYGGTVEAENGLLTFNETVDNTAIVGGFSGTILANDPGAVLNPNGIAINGGRLIINNIGASLYGSGTMSPSTFDNKGVVAADRITLQFSGSGNFYNSNLMTTRERGVLEFANMTLNNNGGVVSAVDTNGLDLQSDGGGVGGTIRLRGATISGGSVLLSGYTSYKGGANDPVAGLNCKLDGYGVLSNINLSLSNAQLNVNPSQVPGGSQLTIIPATTSVATIYNSTVTARNGGNLILRNGTFTTIGSTLTSDDNSFINLDNARLEDAKLVTFGTGRLRVIGTGLSNLSNVKNTGKIDVLAGAKLAISNTIDSRGGAIDNRGTIVMTGADLVGGVLTNNPNAMVQVPSRAQILGVNFVNAGTLFVDTAGNLTVNQSNDGTSSASSFTNIGTFTVGGQAKVVNSLFTTSGDINVLATGSLTATTLAQNAGTVRINGTATVANYQLNAGTLYGAGRITGSLTNNGGVIAPGNSPGTLTVGGDVVLTSDSELDMQVSLVDVYDRIVSESGDMHLTGRVILDFLEMDPEAMGVIYDRPVSFDLFDVAPGHSITAQGLFFEAVGHDIHMSNVAFDPNTGSVSVVVTPEPASLMAMLPLLALVHRKR